MAKKLLLTFALIPPLLAQEPLATHAPVPLQPLAQQVRRLETALNYLGQPLLAADQKEIDNAIAEPDEIAAVDRKSTRLNSSHSQISYAVFCLKKKKTYSINVNHKLQTKNQYHNIFQS